MDQPPRRPRRLARGSGPTGQRRASRWLRLRVAAAFRADALRCAAVRVAEARRRTLLTLRAAVLRGAARALLTVLRVVLRLPPAILLAGFLAVRVMRLAPARTDFLIISTCSKVRCPRQRQQIGLVPTCSDIPVVSSMKCMNLVLALEQQEVENDLVGGADFLIRDSDSLAPRRAAEPNVCGVATRRPWLPRIRRMRVVARVASNGESG